MLPALHPNVSNAIAIAIANIKGVVIRAFFEIIRPSNVFSQFSSVLFADCAV